MKSVKIVDDNLTYTISIDINNIKIDIINKEQFNISDNELIDLTNQFIDKLKVN